MNRAARIMGQAKTGHVWTSDSVWAAHCAELAKAGVPAPPPCRPMRTSMSGANAQLLGPAAAQAVSFTSVVASASSAASSDLMGTAGAPCSGQAGGADAGAVVVAMRDCSLQPPVDSAYLSALQMTAVALGPFKLKGVQGGVELMHVQLSPDLPQISAGQEGPLAGDPVGSFILQAQHSFRHLPVNAAVLNATLRAGSRWAQ